MRASIARHPERFPFRRPPWRLVVAMSLAGVRGAVTLAGVLTIPFTLADGSLFPARQVAIFLAAGVIVVSLVLASVSLPWLMRGLSLPEAKAHDVQEDEARAASVEAAIREVERRGANVPFDDGADTAAAFNRIANEYRDRLHRMEQRRPAAASRHRADQGEGELRLAGIQAEREEVLRLARVGRIGSALSYKLLRELDVAELHHGL
jgi:CPA1 family monovalent cation:H+ antiporter